MRPLLSAAHDLFLARTRPCPVPPLVMMTDPKRLPNPAAAAKALPAGSCVIYRHFGETAKERIAMELKDVCAAMRHIFLIGEDHTLAENCGADGVHLPAKSVVAAPVIRTRHPDWIITGAAHNDTEMAAAQLANLDAVFLSAIFPSDSPSADAAKGVLALKRHSHTQSVFALGGITAETAPLLSGSGAAGLAAIGAFKT